VGKVAIFFLVVIVENVGVSVKVAGKWQRRKIDFDSRVANFES
jgi:hypothetical protein